MNEKVRTPKRGAGRRLAERLKELGRQRAPEQVINKINIEDKKKTAFPAPPAQEGPEAR